MSSSFSRQLHPLKENPRTKEVYLQLPTPLDDIIITPPRLSDVSASPDILNDPRVYKMLLGPPFPYLLEHAESWLESLKKRSDAVLDMIREAAAEQDQTSFGDTTSRDAHPGLVFVGGCPVTSLRKVQGDGTDIFLGEICISRCGSFDYLRDKEKEKVLASFNEELPVGSPQIIWDFGDYLASSHHGKGIMSAALRTILHEWAIPRMNAHIIHAAAYEANVGSVKVFLKNGFKEFDFVKDCVTIPESKGGGMTGLHFLEWKRAT